MSPVFSMAGPESSEVARPSRCDDMARVVLPVRGAGQQNVIERSRRLLRPDINAQISSPWSADIFGEVRRPQRQVELPIFIGWYRVSARLLGCFCHARLNCGCEPSGGQPVHDFSL